MRGSPPAFLAGLQYSARTEVGMRRANNQDSHVIMLAEDDESWEQRGHLFAVADGMGAHAAGEKASKLAVNGISHLYRLYREPLPIQALQRAILDTNREIHRQGEANPEFYSMGTTASVLVILPAGALVGHVGDSRVYRLRGDLLQQLTFDHSLLWELRSLGRFAENSDAARSIPKNVITRSLGPNPEVSVDLEGPYPLELGDTFLLCSDGLTGQVRDEEIGSLLACLSPDEAATTLVDLANLRGGPDNITVIIVRIAGEALLGAAGGASPARHEPRPGPRPWADWTWLVAGVCAALAAILAVADLVLPAIFVGLAALAFAATGAYRYWLLWRDWAETNAPIASEGEGPYVTVSCSSLGGFAEDLRNTLRELRLAAEELRWNLDWDRVSGLEQDAQDALSSGDESAAVRLLSRGISYMWQESLSRRRQAGPSDAAIEY